MRRVFSATLLAVGCATLARCGVSLAQITLVPGPQRSVGRGPQFIASADFNNDGLADAAVTNVIAQAVTVLFGAPDGSFQSATLRQVGNQPRGIATGDFNGDHNPDIAVVDLNLSRVFILAGDGHGVFTPTGNFQTDRRGPVRLAVGNFDNSKGPDIVTANDTANTITTLFNLGGKQGFSPQPNIPIGRTPKAIATADFNGDGYDDIAVVRTGSAGTDEVAILLNNGLGSFQSSAPTNFVVGKGANSLTVGDFNDDGVPDIAVLNAQAIAPATFSISILLNQTTIDPHTNKPIGTGFFNVQQGTQLTCPASINLVPVTCNPRDIKTGDFDGDGFLDLVISVGTLAVNNNNQATSGFVTAFAGRGDGTFDFATQVLIGLGPREMAIGDFNGDGSPDIAVTEFTSQTVRILRSVSPPPRPNGGSCRLGTQCASTFCVDHTCCGRPSCPSGQVCSVKEFPGQCHTPDPNGKPCTDPSQCQSNACVDGACCSTQTCPDGQFCNSGQCGPPSDPGVPCTDGSQCTTGFCVDNFCCSSITCPNSQRCDVPGSEGTCTTPSAPGTPCTDPGQCQSGNCTDGVCCLSASCPTGQVCNAPGNPGVCTQAPTRTPTPTQTPTPQPTGAACAAGAECQSGNCVNNVCCGSSSCPTGQRCDITGSSGVCTPRKGIGDQCGKDSDCVTDNCDPNTSPAVCAAAKTATPTPTQTPKDPGAPCSNSIQCPDGYVCSTDERVCCTSSSCPSGQSCRLTGDCETPPTATPTLTPKQGPGQQCDPSNPDVCASGLFCTNDVCCDEQNCPDPSRCDIFQSEGTCAPQLQQGDPCAKNTDCEDPLICTFDPINNQYECNPPPEPTPTFPPFTPPPTDPGPLIHTSRSGGCSIGRGPDGSQLWLFGVVPLALWLRRRHVQQVRVRSTERGRHQ